MRKNKLPKLFILVLSVVLVFCASVLPCFAVGLTWDVTKTNSASYSDGVYHASSGGNENVCFTLYGSFHAGDVISTDALSWTGTSDWLTIDAGVFYSNGSSGNTTQPNTFSGTMDLMNIWGLGYSFTVLKDVDHIDLVISTRHSNNFSYPITPQNFLINGSPFKPFDYYNGVIPSGYALVISGYGNGTIELSTTSDSVRAIAPTFKAGVIDSLSDINNLALRSFNPVDKNILGQTNKWYVSIPTLIRSSGYFALVNPSYTSVSGEVRALSNTDIYFRIPYNSDMSFQLIPLTSSAATQGTGIVYDVEYVEGSTLPDSVEQVISDEGVISYTSGGAVYIPPSGGNNSGQPTIIYDDNDGVVGVLQNLVNTIKSLFVGTGSFIQQLVGSAGNFLQSVANMFTWMPTAIQTLIVSALGVVIVIGVLKALL